MSDGAGEKDDMDVGGERIRIHIGGLGPTVTAADIEDTFSSLGHISGVEVVRTNGRSMAYMNFQPLPGKTLAALFSKYNGCKWKHGKLKLEKAKEHYLDRLKREWAEEAAKIIPDTHVDNNAEKKDAVNSRLEKLKMEDMQLHMYFPKLRKVKPLPFKGTGKHKYSFQRIEVPTLPIHFCSCDEHRETSEKASQKFISCVNSGVHYEKELSIMSSVMNKLLKKENLEPTINRETVLVTTENALDPSIDDHHEEEYEEEELDADDLVTNIGKRTGDDLEDLLKELGAVNQKPIVATNQPSKNELNRNSNTNSKVKKKVKFAIPSVVRENKIIHIEVPAKPKEAEFTAILLRNTVSETHSQEQEASAEPPHNKKSQTEITKEHSWVQKSSWKNLVGGFGNTSSFSITNVIPGISSLPHDKPMSNDSAFNDSSLNEANKSESQSDSKKKTKVFSNTENPPLEKAPINDDAKESENKEPEIHYQEQETSTEPQRNKRSETEIARGQFWLQKSSWTDLVGGAANTSSFSITNVIPDISSLPQNKPKSNDSYFDNQSLTEAKKVEARSADEKETSILPNMKNHLTEKAPINDDANRSEHKEPIRRDVGVSDVCTFMRNAESVKQWSKVRAALGGKHKKKKNDDSEEDSSKGMKGMRPFKRQKR